MSTCNCWTEKRATYKDNLDDGDGDGDVGLSVPKWHGALRGKIFAPADHPCAAHLIRGDCEAGHHAHRP